MVIQPEIHYYFWQKLTLIRSFVAGHEYSCYCHIKQVYVMIQKLKKPFKKGKCYIGFVAMETGMCIRHTQRELLMTELWARTCQTLFHSVRFTLSQKEIWAPSLDEQTLICTRNTDFTAVYLWDYFSYAYLLMIYQMN